MKPTIFITRKLPDEAIESIKNQYQVKMWDSEDVPFPQEPHKGLVHQSLDLFLR